ncbi:MAG: prolyl oligopeptidase family serine peptidase [Candidatus Muiribacteriota bacterium]
MKKANIVDEFFGVKVSDPYRWLEDDNLKETKEWNEMQNKKFNNFIDLNKKSQIKNRLECIWNFEKKSVPFIEAGRTFFWKNSGVENQFSLYRIENDGSETKILDPNSMSDDGTVAVYTTEISPDGQYLAYSISESGSDWQKIKIKNIKTMDEFEETIEYCRFTGIAWEDDSSGFYYTRYPGGLNISDEEKTKNCAVYFHKLNSAVNQDILFFKVDNDPDLSFYPVFSYDKKFLILHAGRGTESGNSVYIYSKKNKKMFSFFDDTLNRYHYTFNAGNEFYFYTSKNAPNYKLIKINIEDKMQNEIDIICQQDFLIEKVEVCKDKFIVETLEKAHSHLYIYSLNGEKIKKVDLPEFSTINDIYSKPEFNFFYIGVSSFFNPSKIIKYNIDSFEKENFFETSLDFDFNDYKTFQLSYKSKDNTEISMFLMGKKEILDKKTKAPCNLYGYGGFEVCLTPGFSTADLAWYEMGGIKAVVNLRGGGEYGENWHKAGMHEKKQNVFDDFIAAAEFLIQNNYTDRDKLAISGGSNGGLLVGACMNQRPELFNAVICAVPLTDMLRFHKFTIGRYWISEYGNPENSEKEFKTIYAYSPYHNIKKGQKYPNVLILTADTDDRVVPAHARKFAARLQEEVLNPESIYIRVEKNAGHGHGKPVSKIINELADKFVFLNKTLM